MKKIYRILAGIHWFVGVGAVFGGLAAILNPNEPLGMSVDILKNSPFSNYLVPGIILLVIIGLGNILSAILFRFNLELQGYISSVFSWALVIFIFVQCIVLNSIAFLHVLYFIIGLVQAALSAALLFDKRLFPANIITDIYKKIFNVQ